MFVSYAQNFEDVMLYRALREVENGFYVDVGANDPVADSVTKAFYDRGWRGINIEPVVAWHERLATERPLDLNLRLAISSHPGSIPFFENAETGLSTSCEGIARNSKASGFVETSVSTDTLDAILQRYGQPAIHFLKVDVEGAELDVLSTLDLSRFRPWILVIEATEPGTAIPNFDAWEPRVIKNDYQFAYFDGLNRFYVAAEHSDLTGHFQVPPNFFDAFVRHSELNALETSQRLEGALKVVQTQLREAENRHDALAARATALENERSSAARQIAELDRQVTQSQLQIAEINQKHEEALRKLGELMRREAEARDVIAELERRGIEAQRAFDATANQLSIAKGGLAETAARLKASQNKVSEITAQLDRVRNDAAALARRTAALTAENTNLNQSLRETSDRLWRTETARDTAQSTVDDLHRRLHHWWNVAEASQHELRVIHASRSWRLTAPLRSANERIKGILRPLASAQIRFVLARPRLKATAFRVLRGLPKLHARLRSFALANGLILAAADSDAATATRAISGFEPDLADRTRSARRIYDALRTAREAHRRKSAR